MKANPGPTGDGSDLGRAPQVKICGLTSPEEAAGCVEAGAQAIGCVFYPPSPRNLTEERAADICRSLPQSVCTVGVFVNEDFSSIMRRVERCGLRGVQLHGTEPAELAEDLLREGLVVIKGLYMNKEPSVRSAPFFKASAYLIECSAGPLPGGNAMAWDWGAAARVLPPEDRLVLAGGLTPENVREAIHRASPDAVDVSSGVEAAPGRKDMDKVKRFLEAVFQSECSREPRRIF